MTIQAEIRRQMGVKEGDALSLIRLGKTLVGIRRRLVVPEIAKVIEALMQEEEVSLQELLEGLQKQRGISVKEKYGLDAQSHPAHQCSHRRGGLSQRRQ